MVDKFQLEERFLNAYIEGDNYHKHRALNKTICFDRHKRISSAYTFGNTTLNNYAEYDFHKRRRTEVNYIQNNFAEYSKPQKIIMGIDDFKTPVEL